MSLVRIDWHPDAAGLRRWGVAMGVGFSLIGAGFLFLPSVPQPKAAMVCFAIGVACGALGLTGTKIALPFYWLWMAIGWCMGQVMSRVLLVLCWLLVITPLGLLQRALGRDRLRLRPSTAPSLWIPVKTPPDDPRRYLRQS